MYVHRKSRDGVDEAVTSSVDGVKLTWIGSKNRTVVNRILRKHNNNNDNKRHGGLGRQYLSNSRFYFNMQANVAAYV